MDIVVESYRNAFKMVNPNFMDKVLRGEIDEIKEVKLNGEKMCVVSENMILSAYVSRKTLELIYEKKFKDLGKECDRVFEIFGDCQNEGIECFRDGVVYRSSIVNSFMSMFRGVK